MAYRKLEAPPRRPPSEMTDAATPTVVYVQNGATANLAVPCWYMDVDWPYPAHHHCRDFHDHIGWPQPTNPDGSCQDWELAHVKHCGHGYDRHVHSCSPHAWHDHCPDVLHDYIDLDRMFPIHLREEGYDTVKVAVDGKPSGLTVSGLIDAEDDWVVRILFSAKCQEAVKEKLRLKFSVLVSGDIGGQTATDIVNHGELVILPGPYA